MSTRSICRRLLVLSMACLTFSTIAADTAEPDLTSPDRGWDCWVSTDLGAVVVSYRIRCIRPREDLSTDPPADSPSALLLDMVHEKIHQGESLELDLDLAAGRLSEVGTYIRQIRIHQYPYVESWNEGRPQQLVRSALCQTNPDCPVLVSP